MDAHGIAEGVLPENAPLTEDNLALALLNVPCASVLVCGTVAQFHAHRIIGERDQESGLPLSDLNGKLMIHVDKNRSPDAWELF